MMLKGFGSDLLLLERSPEEVPFNTDALACSAHICVLV